jgi:hypothetical protein
MQGQDLACPRIAEPLFTYIGTNGHSSNFLAIGFEWGGSFPGTDLSGVFHFPARAAPSGHVRQNQESHVRAGLEILEKPRKSVIIAAWKRAFPARNSWQADFSWC